MKYPCSDGVNRDDAIESFLILQDLKLKIGVSILEQQAILRKIEAKMNDIAFYKLGSVGIKAIKEYHDKN